MSFYSLRPTIASHILKKCLRPCNFGTALPLSSSSSSLSSLTVTSSSYLLPTLRVDRYDTSETISQKIDLELERNLAARKLLTLGKWSVPIVLDLGAFAPDGSPHYRAPADGLLKDLIETLKSRGLKVIGLTNIAECGGVAEEAALKLGIPAVFGVRSFQNGNKSGRQIDFSSLLKVVASIENELPDNVQGSSIKNGLSYDKSLDDIETESVSAASNDVAKDTTKIKTSEAYESLSYRDLQKYCKRLGLLAQGKRSELLERIERHSLGDNISSPTLESSSLSTSSTNILETHIHKGNVRSGQQVSADGKSLVIMGSVHSGGEIFSDGDIFCFGKLKGRAMAGLRHSSSCHTSNPHKIFAYDFDPELVGIGTTFTTVTDIKDVGLTSSNEVIVSLQTSETEDSPSLKFENVVT